MTKGKHCRAGYEIAFRLLREMKGLRIEFRSRNGIAISNSFGPDDGGSPGLVGRVLLKAIEVRQEAIERLRELEPSVVKAAEASFAGRPISNYALKSGHGETNNLGSPQVDSWNTPREPYAGRYMEDQKRWLLWSDMHKRFIPDAKKVQS